MVKAQDIEAARRRYVAALGTEHEEHCKRELVRLIEKAKQEQAWRWS